MATNNKNTDKSDGDGDIYFKFEGKRRTAVETIDVSIPRAALTAFPNSLLTKLADATWKSNDNPKAGENPMNPILTKPLDTSCKDEWSSCLAPMIADAYRWKYAIMKNTSDDKDDPVTPALPPTVDVEDALTVLDYYGIVLEDLSIINLDQLSDADYIQTKLYLKSLADMKKAEQFIIDSLKQDPRHETLFIFAEKSTVVALADPRFENKLYKYHIGEDNDITKSSFHFVAVGSIEDCDDHYSWSRNPHLRGLFVEQLKEVLSFQIEIENGMYTGTSPHTYSPRVEEPLPGFCCLFIQYHTLDNMKRALCHEAVVLRVGAPPTLLKSERKKKS